VTVLEIIQLSAEFLARKGVDAPRLQTELLLAHLLKLPRMQLYLNFERALAPEELEGFRQLIRRRGRREPLQLIIGSTSFCGLEMTVNRHALIPRPETELLAERAWVFLNQLSPVPPSPAALARPRLNQVEAGDPQPATALDLGTGAGCLGIALAVNCRAARILATDISPEALALARHNAALHGVIDRIQFSQGDGFAALPKGTALDLIISNPPYIPSAEIETLQPEVRHYDPRRALDGGPDGLDYYRRVAAEAGRFLKPDGKIMLEFGDGQAERICEIFQQQMWIVEAVEQDYTRRPRMLIARKPNSATDGYS